MLHNAAFHQDLHCLLRQNDPQIQYFLEIISCDPSKYRIEHPDLTVSNFIENSIDLKVVSFYTYQHQVQGRQQILPSRTQPPSNRPPSYWSSQS